MSSVKIEGLSQLRSISLGAPGVNLLRFPFPRTDGDAVNSKDAFDGLSNYLGDINESSVVCILTTPPDAASLLPYLEKFLKFQLWVAVKTPADSYPNREGSIPNRHSALLVLTKYDGPLRHIKTRIRYSYCPYCGKTTKDYGGKKHTYHEYGTLMSDVWRDIECDPSEDIGALVDRLRDLFGLAPYHSLLSIDMRTCKEFLPKYQIILTPSDSNAAERKAASILESQLLNEDCLQALRTFPENSIDFCFADPPYNLKKKYDRWDDALESVEYFKWCDKWLSQLFRVLKPGRTLAVLNIPLWAVRHYQHLASIINFQAWIVWEALAFPVRMIMPAHYSIICFSKGAPRRLPGLNRDSELDIFENEDEEYLQPLGESYCLRANCVSRRHRTEKSDRSAVTDLWHDVHRLKHNSRRVDHPCQLPPLLMRRLFALFTRPGEIVLDCFNGAGTSTLVAEQMRRKFVGIELSPQYHQIALRRHEQLVHGVDPFGKVDSVPAAKNSPVQRLPKQKYLVSKKALQLDVRRIARELGRLPTREEVLRHSKFPFEYFNKYFISWGEVCAAARTTGMTENPSNANIDDTTIHEQLRFCLVNDNT